MRYFVRTFLWYELHPQYGHFILLDVPLCSAMTTAFMVDTYLVLHTGHS